MQYHLLLDNLSDVSPTREEFYILNRADL